MMNDQQQMDEESTTEVIEGDTYPITDSDATSLMKDDDQDELNDTMSQDSLIADESDSPHTVSSPTVGSHSIVNRKSTLDEHIKLVQQKKDEADELRRQKFQEQLRKKEEKWQQQQLERVKKWLQLRNRDTDHRTQVEERRRKRDEEAKAKFDEILRRDKEREQRSNSNNQRGNAPHRPDSVMSISTDILATRRAISAPRIRSNYRDMTNRRGSNASPISTATSQENTDDSAAAISSHQRYPIDEHRYHRSRHMHDTTMTNEDSSLSGTPHSSAHNRSRPKPTSYAFWLNTGDNNNNHINANFMRSTYAASCRSRLSRSVERCPRACRAHEEAANNTTTTNLAVPTTTATNGEPPQRRVQSVNRQHLNETIRRLSKPKNISMAQSIHVASASSSASNGIPASQSSHQLRVPTPPVTTNNHSTPTRTSSNSRRQIHSRPATAPTHPVSSTIDARASPSDELTSEHPPTTSTIRSSSNRSVPHTKHPLKASSKPPVSSNFTRSKPPAHRSLMSTSLSSSAISSSTTTNKQNTRRIGGAPPAKPKPEPVPAPSIEIPAETQISTKDDNDNEEEEEEEEEEELKNLPVNEDTQENEATVIEEVRPSSPTPPSPTVEPINIDTVTEIINSTEAAVPPPPTATTPISKREQQILDEQEYQRKLNQKIREAQQRLEAERQREEERQRQLELEEYEREQEQIRLVEEQCRAEQERLQRAIEERERENELKRQEEQRLQQQREELERKQAEEAERLARERQERAKKEEEERNERKRRLDLIMRRTRQGSPGPKVTSETNNNKPNSDETNGHDQEQSTLSHSISDNRFPISISTDNFLDNNINNDSAPPASETPKFKSPLIQSLLNKARNSRSTDNLNQSSMTASQITAENEVDEEIPTTSTVRIVSSDDEDQQDSGINNTTNGHSDSPLSSSTNLNSYHDHPIETTIAFQ